jgi:hypothetical protein
MPSTPHFAVAEMIPLVPSHIGRRSTAIVTMPSVSPEFRGRLEFGNGKACSS